MIYKKKSPSASWPVRRDLTNCELVCRRIVQYAVKDILVYTLLGRTHRTYLETTCAVYIYHLPFASLACFRNVAIIFCDGSTDRTWAQRTDEISQRRQSGARAASKMVDAAAVSARVSCPPLSTAAGSKPVDVSVGTTGRRSSRHPTRSSEIFPSDVDAGRRASFLVVVRHLLDAAEICRASAAHAHPKHIYEKKTPVRLCCFNMRIYVVLLFFSYCVVLIMYFYRFAANKVAQWDCGGNESF